VDRGVARTGRGGSEWRPCGEASWVWITPYLETEKQTPRQGEPNGPEGIARCGVSALIRFLSYNAACLFSSRSLAAGRLRSRRKGWHGRSSHPNISPSVCSRSATLRRETILPRSERMAKIGAIRCGFPGQRQSKSVLELEAREISRNSAGQDNRHSQPCEPGLTPQHER
jgi:hypothetical protein